jgi:adenosyl cobinamide kinase/adenosyl cobinamide phosphate guanylyltransferase
MGRVSIRLRTSKRTNQRTSQRTSQHTSKREESWLKIEQEAKSTMKEEMCYVTTVT